MVSEPGCEISASIELYIDSLPYITIVQTPGGVPLSLNSMKYYANGEIGTPIGYDVVVNNHCGYTPGTRVQLEFEIRDENGQLVIMDTWNSLKSITYKINSLLSDDPTFPPVNAISTFPISLASGNVPEGNTSVSGEFYSLNGGPGVGTVQYRWLHLNFLDERPVTVNYDYFVEPGTYTITYRLVGYPAFTTGTIHGILYDNAGNRIGGPGMPTGTKVTLATRQVILQIDPAAIIGGYELGGIVSMTTKEKPAVNIHPNPAISTVNIEVKGFEGNTTISIYDLNGRLIENITTDLTSSTKITRQLTDYSNGVYFVKVSNNEAVITRKLVISK